MKKKAFSGNIANAIIGFLTEDDWHYSFDDQRGLFRFNLVLKGRIKKLNYIVDVKNANYVVYAISPIGADENDEKMMAVIAEFICRANYGLKNGNFEFDMRDGEIRYKTFVDCDGITPTTEMIRNSIYYPAMIFDRYSSGITDIIFGNATAKAAIANCEKSPEEVLLAILGEEVGEGEDMEAMITRLATRFGIDESELRDAGDQSETNESETEVITDLFGVKGVIA